MTAKSLLEVLGLDKPLDRLDDAERSPEEHFKYNWTLERVDLGNGCKTTQLVRKGLCDPAAPPVPETVREQSLTRKLRSVDEVYAWLQRNN